MGKYLVRFRTGFYDVDAKLVEPVKVGDDYYDFKTKKYGENRYIMDKDALKKVREGKFVIDLYKDKAYFLNY